jgi:HAD superfamily hydrolase (TIGR01509 family)
LSELKLLIFDVDGTLVDSERYGHLPASNDAMEQLGLSIRWSWEEFLELLPIPGNVNRLRKALADQGLPAGEIEEIAGKFAPLKQRIYIEKYLPALRLRQGIRELIAEAVQRGVELAVVSTSYEAQIRALLQNQLTEFVSHFRVILGKESGPKTGPEGKLYQKCLEQTGYSAEEALAVEDSQEGLRAAVAAGIPTVVFYNDYTFGSDFSSAILVAPGASWFNLDMLEAMRAQSLHLFRRAMRG